MVLRENEDLQEFTVFMQPPKKQTGFKHPLKEEEVHAVLALSKGFVSANTRKNTTWAYKVFSDWPAEKEQQDRKTMSRKFVLSTCISIVRLLSVPSMFCVYVHIAYCCCLCAYFLFLLLNTFYQSLVECCSYQLCVECCQSGVECCSCPIECCCCQLLVKCSCCQLFVVEFFYCHSCSWPLYSWSHAHPVKL